MARIRLYINGIEADCGSSESLLLFTYAAGDLNEPAVVQNAYSKEVVLPPTPRNAKIFGAMWRPDKVTGSADAFRALERTPFEIRSLAGEVLESGYCKLEGVSREEGYTLTLYGGLGSFLYGLMYNEDGTKKTLADLVWSDAIEAGLSFNIDKSIVQAAWDRLNVFPYSVTSAYDVINFAPMHNGLPSGFDASRGLVPVGGAHGCDTVYGMHGITIDGTTYALVDFGKEFTEWEVRDLRSYLQRPVFSIQAFLTALGDVQNNGGYTFDWSAVSSLEDLKSWMTLRMLQTDEGTQEAMTLTTTWGSNNVSTAELTDGKQLQITIAESLDANKKTDISLGIKIGMTFTNSSGGTITQTALNIGDVAGTWYFLRLIGYDSSNNVVALGKVRCLYPSANTNVSWLNTAKRLVQNLPSVTYVYENGTVRSSVFGNIVPSEIEGQPQGFMGASADTDMINLSLTGYNISKLGVAIETQRYPNTGGVFSPVVYYFYDDTYDGAIVTAATLTEFFANAVQETNTQTRTGSYISKQALLGDTPSPADLLLSLVKTFGLVLSYDGLTKTVSLMNRDDFYTGTEVDISARIDRTRAYEVQPNGIDEKWLEFALQPAEGAFAEGYRAKYGIGYGAKRANTGSPFNADTLQVLEGVSFKEGVTGLDYGRYYWIVKDSSVGSGVLPAPYLDNNCKYTLWATSYPYWGDAGGEPTSYDIASLTSAATLATINDLGISTPNGYDAQYRIILKGKDNAGADDGMGILLWQDALISEYIALSDDDEKMLAANNGTPCWMPYLSETKNTIPSFISVSLDYNWGDVSASLNMGTPLELCGYDYWYEEGFAIYDRRWQAYIRDRYSENSHRVTCYVDWSGMQVGQAMFGQFYYFDGCTWVLDRIEDWCWDNPQPCKCTFVRVLDKNAYTDGQS